MDADRPLVGRDREVATIIERLHDGVGTVIVGSAGIGKSAVARELKTRLQAQGQRCNFISCSDWGGTAFQTEPERSSTPNSVLIVDDAHLLDGESAQQLSRVVRAGDIRIVATVRSEDKPLYSLGWLWSASRCERLALDPLDEDGARLLLEHLLGGAVDERLASSLIARTRGNPLLIGELVTAGVESGALVRDRATWHLLGDLPLTGAVTDTIRANLSGLVDPQLQAMQTLAVAQPVRLSLAERVADLGDLESLESRGLVVVDSGGAEPTLSCSHPLYAEVLRADLGRLRSRRLRGQLLRAMVADSRTTDRERLLAVSWKLELDEAVDGNELLGCAHLATSTNPALAERLLRTAIASGAGAPAAIEAVTILAELLLVQGRAAEADHVLNPVDADPTPVDLADATDEQRERLATVRVLIRTRLGEITEALRLVGAAPDAEPDERVSLQTQALYAQILLLSARLDEAVRITEPLLAQSVEDQVALGVAAYTVVTAYSFIGQLDDAERALQASLPILSGVSEQLPYGTAIAQVSTAIGQVLTGRFAAAGRLGQRMQDEAQRTQNEWLQPRGATVLGLLALHRGQASTALRHLRDAIASLNQLDAMFVRYNLAFLARAAALAGNLEEAAQALQPPPDAPQFPLYEADWQIAEAAVLAAQCRLKEAAARAMTAAHTAASHAQWPIAAIAAHDAARYADSPEAGTFLTTMTDVIDGPLPPLMREHALARTADDGARLHAVSVEFERLGAMLFAAEAAYACARSHRRTNGQQAAAWHAGRAAELLSRCEPVVIPWSMTGRNDLTAREQQVALLAAAGHPDRHISTQLGISIRTAQTHLTHVYTKLGISRRSDLPTALTNDALPR